MVSSDRALGLVVLCIAGGVFAAGFGIDIPPGSEDSLSPRFFPQLLAIVLGGLGLALLAKGGGLSLHSVWAKLGSSRSLALLGLTALYTLTFGVMDFRLGTLLFVGGGMWIMGARGRLELTLVPAAVACLVYLLFRYGFLVLLPVWS